MIKDYPDQSYLTVHELRVQVYVHGTHSNQGKPWTPDEVRAQVERDLKTLAGQVLVEHTGKVRDLTPEESEQVWMRGPPPRSKP